MSEIISYKVMHKDIPVFVGRINTGTGLFTEIREVITPKHLPPDILYLDWDKTKTISLNKVNRWWTKRSFPETRDGLVPLMGYLRVPQRAAFQLLNRGLSLSDCYWIQKETDDLKWENVNFFTNDFSMDVGKAIFDERNKDYTEIDTMSPDLSTNGWLKKTWRIKNDIRYLLKAGSAPNKQEPINEVLATKLLETLNFIPYVSYSLTQIRGTVCSACRCFLDENTEFIPAALIYKTEPRPEERSVYQHLIERCNAFGIKNVSEFIDRMLQVDFILANSDRHLGNFGFFRNADTLEFMGPAPLFDNGTALWNQDAGNKIITSMNLSKPFENLHKSQIEYVNHFHITPQILADIPELFEEIMVLKSTMSKERIINIRKAVKENIESFNRIVEKAPKEKQPTGEIKPMETSFVSPFSEKEKSKDSLLDDIISGARKTLRENRTPSNKPKLDEETQKKETRGGRL